MEKLDKILASYTAQGDETVGKVLGAAFVVTDRNGTIYSGASGRLDGPQSSPAFADNSYSWVASLTKLLTSISAMQLVERGLITLDEDLRPKIPYFQTVQILTGFDDNDKPIMENNTKPITLRHLLTHTSGFSYEFADPKLLKWSRQQGNKVSRVHWSVKEISTPLRHEPGELFTYGVSTDWAGLVIEHITGQRLGDYMQANIFGPLGMKDSGFRRMRKPHVEDREVVNSLRHPKTGKLVESGWILPDEHHEVDSGGGGLFTTAADYACVLRGFLDNKLLKSETAQEMVRPQLGDDQRQWLETIAFHPTVKNTFVAEFDSPVPLNYGLGGVLNTENVPGRRRAMSMAWSGIHCSRWWIDPTTGIGAVLILNIRPHGDQVVARLYQDLEAAVYSQLLPAKGKL